MYNNYTVEYCHENNNRRPKLAIADIGLSLLQCARLRVYMRFNRKYVSPSLHVRANRGVCVAVFVDGRADDDDDVIIL